MDRRAWVLAALVAAVLLVPVLARLGRGEAAKEVELAEATRFRVSSSVLASGQLAYREQVQLRAEVIGRVVSVAVAEGDTVRAGDRILTLDPEQFRTLVEQQRANVRLQEIAIARQRLMLDNLERRFERSRELFQRELVDANTHEALENELDLGRIDLRSREESLAQARASLAQAEDTLAKTEIRSPIDGVIIQLDVKPGESVVAATTNIPGSTLAVVADVSSVRTELRVDEADIAQVAVGQEAAVFAAAFPDHALSAVVESIATSATRAEGQQNLSFEVKLRLTDPDLTRVRPGMSCRAEIYTQSSEDALAVPVQAVLYDEDVVAQTEQPYVFVANDGKAEKRPVRVGLASDSHIEILEGLTEHETVVVGPIRALRSLRVGDAVKAAPLTASDSKLPARGS
ncbi:MAG TPA: efflux transporter periplasmic adaptor subunit [Xanthomonadales bacterium]|nr:efflux transporter periplasmic adaptor subunit [Xanthomonadales bacterium]